MSAGSARPRPSDARREALRKQVDVTAQSLRVLSNFTPIARYYDISAKLFHAFEICVQHDNLDDAYVFGKRYANFCMISLPTHDYYMSSRPELKRMRITRQKNLEYVAVTLEEVVRRMDQEEVERSKHVAQQPTLEEKLRQLHRPTAASTQQVTAFDDNDDRLEFPVPPTGFTQANSIPKSTTVVPFSDSPKRDASVIKHLTPPIEMPPPPSYSNEMSLSFYSDDLSPYKNLLYHASSSPLLHIPVASPLYPTSMDDITYPSAPAFSSSSSIRNMHIEPTIKHDSRLRRQIISPEDMPISMEDLCTVYTQEYEDYKAKKMVQTYDLETHQGRVMSSGRDSTNGCTVISPLVIKNHLRSSGPGIADCTIESVIDSEAPPILSEVRKKLGLQPCALIIPSDVHDYFIDKKLLTQEQFVGACGGNILDPIHRGELVSMLRKGHDHHCTTHVDISSSRDTSKNSIVEKNGGKNQSNTAKVGAALFFHEHVISILKLVFPDGTCWYDLIDSLPRTTSKDKGSSDTYYSTRTRCKSIEALDATLRWYACTKFTDSDKSYIDANLWDDALCDFDPRVFQAFVWANRK